jgi:low affinity Fe/Cu permease
MKAFIKRRFEVLAEWISASLGRPMAFLAALAIVALWAVSGPLFAYSDTWQLVINTGTTISTFLMVFLLQNTGNRTIAVGASLDYRSSRQFEQSVTGNSTITARLVSIPAPPEFLALVKDFLKE